MYSPRTFGGFHLFKINYGLSQCTPKVKLAHTLGQNLKVTKMSEKQNPKSKIRIKLRAYDYRIVDKSAQKICDTAERTGAVISGPIPLPTERKLYTVLRSTFVKKDARDQFEMKIHKRLIDIISPTNKTIDSLMSLDLPTGVDIEIKM